MSARYTPPSAASPRGAPVALRDAAIPLVLIAIIGSGTVVITVAHLAALAAAGAGFPVPPWGSPTLAALLDTSAATLDPLLGPDGS
ncbi:MAG: hypothetical protein ACRD0H_05280, partial [Actinomycetes bacterium]